jgi:P27 family predicted phage terminase small subunit
MDYITKSEALEILGITSYQHLRRTVKKHNVQTKSLGVGKATLYLKSDICSAVVEGKDTQKFAPKKEKEKAKEKKEVKIQKAKVKEEAKKEIEAKTKNPLNETGQSEFLRAEQELKDNGTYRELDRALLIAYAISFQNYMFYIDLSATLDHTTVDDNGNQKVNAYFTVADKCFSQMDKMATKLGIGVRSRVGLGVKEPTEESLMSKLLNS